MALHLLPLLGRSALPLLLDLIAVTRFPCNRSCLLVDRSILWVCANGLLHLFIDLIDLGLRVNHSIL